MKRKRKEIIAIALAGLLAAGVACSTVYLIPQSVSAVEINGSVKQYKDRFGNIFGFTQSVASISIVSFQPGAGVKDVAVPNKIDNITVKHIGHRVFKDCKNIETVALPDSILSIGCQAFMGCSKLRAVNIPYHVTTVYGEAFRDCTSLRGLSLPDSITSFGAEYQGVSEGVLKGCVNLEELNLGRGVSRISGVLSDCKNLRNVRITNTSQATNFNSIFYGMSKLQAINLPNLTNSIRYTFKGCSSLRAIEIPDTVEDMTGAFKDCTNLRVAVMPSANFTTYEKTMRAFENCSHLEEVYIPSGVTKLHKDMFKGCSSLTDIYYGGTPTRWEEITANPDMSENGALDTGMNLPRSVNIHFNSSMPSKGSIASAPNIVVSQPVMKPENAISNAQDWFKGNPLNLDTTNVNMEVGATYTFLIRNNFDIGNLSVEPLDTSMADVWLHSSTDPRGAMYTIRAKKAGHTSIKVQYNNQESYISVDAKQNTNKGSIMLDTANYMLAPGNIYDIGVTIKDPQGNKISGNQVKWLLDTGKLKVRDSRTGSIVDLVQLPNGNFRVKGKNPGTCYIVYDIGGNHASVRIDVVKGIQQHGTAVRNTSLFVTDVF